MSICRSPLDTQARRPPWRAFNLNPSNAISFRTNGRPRLRPVHHSTYPALVSALSRHIDFDAFPSPTPVFIAPRPPHPAWRPATDISPQPRLCAHVKPSPAIRGGGGGGRGEGRGGPVDASRGSPYLWYPRHAQLIMRTRPAKMLSVSRLRDSFRATWCSAGPPSLMVLFYYFSALWAWLSVSHVEPL